MGRDLAGALVAPLAWLGRQRARAVGASIFVALLVPPVGRLLAPFVTEAVIGLLVIAFLRLDAGALRQCLARPGLIASATLWSGAIVPLLVIGASRLAGIDRSAPDLYLALVLQGVTAPVMSSPAFASLMGLDATLVLTTLVASAAILPLLAPPFARLAGLDLALSPIGLGLTLGGILLGSAIAGLALRRFVGRSRIDGGRDALDGLNILLLFVFIAGLMRDVGARLLSEPLPLLGIVALSFAVFAATLGLTTLAFLPFGPRRALAVGVAASGRNMGLMLAGVGGMVPDLTWLYFALGQFPIFLSPLLVRPIAARLPGALDDARADETEPG